MYKTYENIYLELYIKIYTFETGKYEIGMSI